MASENDLAASWDAVALEEEFNLYRALNIGLSTTSLGSALLAFLVAVGIYRFSKVSKRVSFRMVMGLALSDAGVALSQLVSLFQDEGVMCTLTTYFFILFTLLSQFMTVCIAFHLHMVVVLEVGLPRWVEALYFGVSGMLALFIATMPALFGRIGYDEVANSCWFVDEKDPVTLVWQMSTLYAWIFLAILYCTIVFLMLVYSIFRNELRPATLPPRQVRMIILRVALYPIVPALTMSLNFIVTVLVVSTGEGNYTLSLLAMVLLSSQGWINALIFCFDPVVRSAGQHARINIVHSQFPVLSRSPSARQPTKAMQFLVRCFLLTRRERGILENFQLLHKPTPFTPLPILDLRNPDSEDWLASI